MLFEPSETLDINISADFTSREENCCVGMTTVRGPTAAIINALVGGTGVAPVADPFARVAWSNRSTEQDIKDKGVAVELNWESPWFGGSTLTSITAQRDCQAINGLDFDFTSADLLTAKRIRRYVHQLRDRHQDFPDTAAAIVWTGWSGVRFRRGPERTTRTGSAMRTPRHVDRVLRDRTELAQWATSTSQATRVPFGQASAGPPRRDFAGLGATTTREDSRSARCSQHNAHANRAIDLTWACGYTRERKRLNSCTKSQWGAG